jgi:hypothetical protein
MNMNKPSTINAEIQPSKKSKNSAKELDHSRKLMPVRTPLGRFNNSYAAAKQHKITLWTLWQKVMDPHDHDYVIDADSLHDPR